MPLEDPKHFEDIGVYIGVLNSLTEKQVEFQDDVVAAVEQLDSDFIRVSIMPAFISNMTSANNSITAGSSNLVAAVTDYHLNVLADELPSTAGSVSGVITDFFAAMVASGLTFQEDGNFHSLYRDRYGRLDVPTAASGAGSNVDDSLGD